MQQDGPRADRARSAVYQAEDTVARIMSRSHRAVRIGREVVVLPAGVSFGSLGAVQEYVDAVLADPRTRAAHPHPGSVLVRAKRGFRSATYQDGVILLPAADARGRWALSQAVVLHEVAHHLAQAPGHDTTFRSTLLQLYREHLGEPAAQVLAHLLAPLDDLPDAAGADPAGVAEPATRRVAGLLAKASSTASPEESEAYLAKATEIAARHSIDLAVAALSTRGRTSTPTHRILSIGVPRARLNTILASLYVRIAQVWAIPVDIGPGSTYVLGYGLPDDLDQVEAVYVTASTLMTSRAEQHVRSGRWRGQTYRPRAGGTRPVSAAVARQAFCLGFIQRLGHRLDESAARARLAAEGAAAAATSPGSGPTPGTPAGTVSVELALRARAIDVADYHRRVTRARGAWRGSMSGSASATGSRHAGARAADEYGASALAGPGRAIEA